MTTKHNYTYHLLVCDLGVNISKQYSNLNIALAKANKLHLHYNLIVVEERNSNNHITEVYYFKPEDKFNVICN